MAEIRYDMPVRYIVLNNGNLVIERWVGRISHAEVIDHERQQLNDISIKRGARILADTREAVFPETTIGDRLDELMELHSDPKNKTTIAKCALVVNDETWAQAKAIEAGTEKHNMAFIAFTTLDIACAWLGIDYDTAMNHLKQLEPIKPFAGGN